MVWRDADKCAVADEMELQIDTVALVRITPAAKNSGVSLGLGTDRNAHNHPDQGKKSRYFKGLINYVQF